MSRPCLKYDIVQLKNYHITFDIIQFHKDFKGITTSYHPHLSQVLALFQQRNCIIFAPALLTLTCLLHFGGFRLCYQTNVTISKGMKSNYRIFTRIALNSLELPLKFAQYSGSQNHKGFEILQNIFQHPAQLSELFMCCLNPMKCSIVRYKS